jgi:hypothetical protein
MHRIDVQISPDLVRTERMRTRGRDRYCDVFGGAPWIIVEQESTSSFTSCRTVSVEQLVSAVSAKLLYRESMQSLDRDKLQPTWGRIQQKSEMDYDLVIAELLGQRHEPQEADKRVILEEFDGFVDQIDGETAYVTLTSKAGEILHGEYPASELKAQGIQERRRFRCRTIDAGSQVAFELEAIPDIEVSEERERAIREAIRDSLGDDDGSQDDY